MPEIFVPAEQAKPIIATLIREQGGLAAMAVGSVPSIVDKWKEQGVLGLTVNADSVLGRRLIKAGWKTR